MRSYPGFCRRKQLEYNPGLTHRRRAGHPRANRRTSDRPSLFQSTHPSRGATTKAGYHARNWRKHGKLPWVEYDTVKVDEAVEEAKKTIKQKAGLTDSTIDYLAAYKYGDDLLKKLAAAMK